ncbi:hypothetical protein EMIT0158MI4_100223 [Burkholderia ambifaria]
MVSVFFEKDVHLRRRCVAETARVQAGTRGPTVRIPAPVAATKPFCLLQATFRPDLI